MSASDDARKPELPQAVAAVLAEEEARASALHQNLGEVEAQLRARGLTREAEELHQVREDAWGFGGFGRRVGGLAKGLGELASRQWNLFTREMSESRDVLDLVRRRLRGEIRFSKDEEAMVRDQLADLFRMVPATAMALAPVPGIALLTPFVLKKLNLLPSSWREAHVVHRLRSTAETLEGKGENQEAARLREMATELEARHEDRSDRVNTLRRYPEIRVLYDFNMDGVIDDEEWGVLKQDREDLLERVRTQPDQPGWYFTTSGEVEGPVRLAQLLAMPLPEQALVHGPGLARWMPIELLLEAASQAV